jgi:hypothetical protein
MPQPVEKFNRVLDLGFFFWPANGRNPRLFQGLEQRSTKNCAQLWEKHA